MKEHSHDFVETYSGLVGFGLDRQTDENTVIYYLQKFSDDQLMKRLMPSLTHSEMEDIFEMINRLLKKYLSDTEYHRLFLKEEHP